MKNYEEMTESLFRRRDEYNRIKKAKIKKAGIIISSVSCLCITVLFIVAAMNTKSPEALPKSSTSQSANAIYINKVDAIPSALAKPEFPTEREELNIEKIDIIYQTNIIPHLPDDFEEYKSVSSVGGYASAVDSDGKPIVSSYSTEMEFWNEEHNRSVIIEAYTGEIFTVPATENQYDEKSYKNSYINGTDVFIAQDSKNGYFFAKFTHKDVYFRIITKDLTEDEVVSIIESLMD